jgi:hypothetical protein
VLREEVRD